MYAYNISMYICIFSNFLYYMVQETMNRILSWILIQIIGRGCKFLQEMKLNKSDIHIPTSLLKEPLRIAEIHEPPRLYKIIYAMLHTLII